MQLRLTDILDTAESAIVTKWHFDEHAKVKKGDDLVELVTDKATFDVEAPCEGRLMKIFKKTGEKVLSDEVILEIA